MKLTGYDVLIRRVVEDGQVIFPEAFCLTEEERIKLKEQGKEVESIERLRASNRSKFFGQYLNDPLDDALLEFRREWFQTYDIQPGGRLAQEFFAAPVLISVDPAFKLGQINDDTGIVVTKTLSDNNVYIVEAKGIKANPKMLVEEIFRLIERYVNVDRVLIETVTSQIMLLDLLQAEMKQRNVFFSIQEVRPESNEVKAVRIRRLIPHYSNRRIFHAPNLYQLEDQLIEFPKGAHDDIIDALSYQTKYWRPFNQAQAGQQIPHGSYEWWKRKTPRKITRLGSLFKDLR